jgi:hypothetical protein
LTKTYAAGGMTDSVVKEQIAMFIVNCTRCRGQHRYDSAFDMNAAMVFWYNLGDGIAICPDCALIVNEVRKPYVDAAYNAAVDEINQYHADHPVQGAVLSVLGGGGEVH